MYWLQISIGLIPHWFWRQIYITTFDISFEVFLQAWPIVCPANPFFDCIDFKMTCNKVVIILVDQFGVDDSWDMEEFLMIEHFFNIFLAFLQLFYSDFLNFKIFLLQIFKPSPYSSYTSLVKVLLLGLIQNMSQNYYSWEKVYVL